MNTIKIVLIAGMLCAGFQSALAQEPPVLDKDLLVQLVNEARTQGCKCGKKEMPAVAPIKWNDTLAQAAQLHSNDMQKRKYFNHVSPNKKSTPQTRVEKLGYRWRSVAENIAQGFTTERDVVNGWLKSPGHCRNIMLDNVTEMGVAINGDYWTQVFAAPKPADWK